MALLGYLLYSPLASVSASSSLELNDAMGRPALAAHGGDNRRAEFLGSSSAQAVGDRTATNGSQRN